MKNINKFINEGIEKNPIQIAIDTVLGFQAAKDDFEDSSRGYTCDFYEYDDEYDASDVLKSLKRVLRNKKQFDIKKYSIQISNSSVSISNNDDKNDFVNIDFDPEYTMVIGETSYMRLPGVWK